MKNLFLFFSLIFCFFCLSCAQKAEKELSKKEIFRNKSATELNEELKKSILAQDEAIFSFFNSLSDYEKIAQIFLVNVAGKTRYIPQENCVPGGVLLFSFNVSQNLNEFSDFLDSIKSFSAQNKNIPPYISLDQEGGLVNRLSKITSPLPSQKWVSQNLSPPEAYALYFFQGEQMKSLGIDLNLAPVVEILNDENEDFLQSRSFGSAENAIRYGFLAKNAFENAGLGSVLKHFPGNSKDDPHLSLPKIKIEKESFEKKYFLPFERILKKSGEKTCVLMSHAIFLLDNSSENENFFSQSEEPACLSEFWVTKILREKLNFRSLIISDDIFMDALLKNGFLPKVAAQKALMAGVDVLMISGKNFLEIADFLLEKSKTDLVLKNRIENAALKVLRFKIALGILKICYIGNEKYKIEINYKKESKSEQSEKFFASYKKGCEILEQKN